jgi:amino acid adenylation domain-containing protein
MTTGTDPTAGPLTDGTSFLNLPIDRDRTTCRDYRPGQETTRLDTQLTARVTEAASRERVTLAAVLVSVAQVLLHRLTGQTELTLSVRLDRSEACLSPPPGIGTHIPVRSRLTGSQSFRELLKATSFAAGSAPTWDLAIDSTARLVIDMVDLSMSMTRTGTELGITCEYNANLLDAATIDRWLRAYERLLTGVAADPDAGIATLPWVAPEDLRLIEEWNRTAADVPDVCVHQLVEAQAKRSPDATAAEFEGRAITYDALNRRANQIARRLRDLGVSKNILVGLCVDRSIDMLAGVLGILKAGGAYVPLDPAYPADRVALMIADSGMSVIIMERTLRDRVTVPPAVQVLFVDDPSVAACDDGNLPKDRASATSESIAYVIYTSGSTGLPKGVLVPHRAVVNLLASVARRPGLAASDVVLAITTLSFDIAVSEILLPLTVGARIVIVSRAVASDGVELLRLMRDARVTFVDATPSTWRLLIDAGWDGGEGLTAICTGEAMPRDLARELVERAGRVWNGYGPTETTVWSTLWEVKRPVERILIGAPIANTRIHVLDERRQPVAIGVPGEIYIAGTGVTSGYLNRPDLTRARFLPDPFDSSPSTMYRTGDLGRYLNSGELECLGRNDDQVKVRGFRIELGEIEDVLGRHEAVARAAVVAREDRPGDRRLVAYIVTREAVPPADAALRAHVSRVLPDYMVPAAFVHLDELPLTPSGKVDRQALPAPSARRGEGEPFVAPRTPTETMLAGLWQQVLGLERVSVAEDFFSLGGHSLLASQVLARLRRDHGLEIQFRTFFEASTIAEFAGIVDTQPRTAKQTDRTIPHRRLGEPSPLSVAQERMWLLEMMDPHQRIVHNMPCAWRLTGSLDEGALERSLSAIVARHDTLRTRIVVRDGVPSQELDPNANVALGRLDLRALPAADREAAMRGFFDREIAVPFDLSSAPLFRATLIRLDETEHVLFALPHNIIWDGRSFEILLRDLGALYTAFVTGALSALAPLPISYADFTEWQREWLTGTDSADQRAWWHRQLNGDLPVLEIPSDFPRPAELTRAAAHVHTTFSREDVDELMAIARDSKTTLFTVMFAVFCVLLHRTSGQAEVIVGTPVRARTRPEMEDLLGPFMNMLVLRSRLDRGATFIELLSQLRDTTLDAFSHQELPLEDVDVRAPVLRAFFTYQDVRERPHEFGGLSVEPLAVMPATSDADLRLEVLERADGLAAVFTCSRDLFDVESMHRFLGRFRTLVADVSRHPHTLVADLELLARDERSFLHHLGGALQVSRHMVPVHTRFELHAEQAPRSVAIADRGAVIEYGELNRRANAIAVQLRSSGIGPGSRVAVYINRSAELVAALLGAMKAGATWVSLDTEDPPIRLAVILRDSVPELVLTTRALGPQLPGGSPPALNVDHDQGAADAPALHSSRSIDGTACLLYADKENGVLRGSVLSHRELARAVANMADALAMTSDDVALGILPPSLDSSVIELMTPLSVGARLVIAEDDVAADPELLADAARSATVAVGSTMLWRTTLGAVPHSCPSLRVVCIGSLPDAQLIEELTSRTASAWLAQGYAEAGIWSTLLQLRDGEPPSLLGRPLPGAHVRILDGRQRDVPIGLIGELCVGSVEGSPGYATAIEGDDERFVTPADGRRDRLYRTGHRARWRSDGTLERMAQHTEDPYVFGFRVNLDEIAEKLRQHPAIADAAVIMRSRGMEPERLVAYVVPHDGRPYTNTELRRHLKETLPARMVPRAFIEIDFVPRSGTGALDAGALQGEGRTEDLVPPHSTMEILLARLWGQALQVEHVGVHDNFFSLGGYSLLCFQVLDRIERETGRRISPRLMLLDSLQQIAARLDQPLDHMADVPP